MELEQVLCYCLINYKNTEITKIRGKRVLKTRFLRYGLGLALTILFVLHASQHFPIPVIQTLENLAYDFRLKLTLPKQVDKKVVIIDIDEKSLNQIGQWPWDRNILAQIVDNLFDYYKVKVLGFDIFFAEKDENPGDLILKQMAKSPLINHPDFQSIYTRSLSSMHRDERFARSLENRNVVMGMVLYEDKTLNKGQLPRAIPEFTPEIINSFSFMHAASYTANLPILQNNAKNAGFIDNPLLDEDGVFRKVPLLQAYDNKMYQSLALAIARASLQNDKIKLGYEIINEQTNQRSLEWLYVGETAIPVDENAGVLVPYIGRQKSFDYVSAVDIYNKTAPKETLANMITIFGTSAAGLLDLRTTPLGKAYPGVEVHANIIQGILDKTIKHKPEYIVGFEILLLILLGLTLTFLLPQLSPIWSTLCMLIALGISMAIDSYTWNTLKIVLPIASPVLLILMLYGLNMSYGFFVESRGKRHLTHLFGQYVPPELVGEMSRNLKEINLDGEIREMSVLFTDVRNFTTISENMEPKELTRFINAFLTPLTRVIHTNRGTIDKYMGDAIMAFWGAPLEDKHHAHNALIAGMQMLDAIRAVRADFAKKGWPEIHIGVGINSGQMNVGNKGSEFRVDYTVLGDAVNLGSRLEGLTKTYGVEIITSEMTRHAVPEFEYRELDKVRVKGRDIPVTIYEPIGLVETIDKVTRKSIKEFHHAIKLYRAQKWDDAEQTIFALSQQDPERLIYKIYLDRIAYFRNHPPGPGWDGVFTHTSK